MGSEIWSEMGLRLADLRPGSGRKGHKKPQNLLKV